ncbi:MAG: hypothetical protein Q9162_001742 [Coniocarpon cinnabarinum]
MGLVNYSDSEESGGDSRQHQAKLKQKASLNTSSTNRPAFEKVVDDSDSSKIRISLPSHGDDHERSLEGDGADGPPAKRPKTSGAFSGFGSLLPAPKNQISSKTAISGGSVLARNKGSQSAGRINLKTSATPAFSREAQQGPNNDEEDTNAATFDHLTIEQLPSSSAREEPEPNDVPGAGTNSIVFKPLSVSRKPKKKKPPAGIENNNSVQLEGKRGAASNLSASDQIHGVAPKKTKVPLFGSSATPSVTEIRGQAGHEYEPILDDEDNPDPEDGENVPVEPATKTPGLETTQSQDLNKLANSLGLSASERRQLFGRGGKPTNAQVAQFNLAQEYKHNQRLQENEESTPSHNPVKSIAPGKHSLQQLVSAAQTNKDALDESFARGKSNKKAAGSKYGW